MPGLLKNPAFEDSVYAEPEERARKTAAGLIGGSRLPQRSNAARVCNMSRFNGGKLPGNSKHFFKKSKDKAVLGKKSFKR